MSAEHLLTHYERIADAPDAVVRLRRFVLDLAVRGKLVPQDPSDEAASAMLGRIKVSPVSPGDFELAYMGMGGRRLCRGGPAREDA
jgi:type I restriction enzyme S subunit